MQFNLKKIWLRLDNCFFSETAHFTFSALFITILVLLFTHSFIYGMHHRVHSARCRHPSPEWTILRQVSCFVQGERGSLISGPAG